jgi:hypothetical protein
VLEVLGGEFILRNRKTFSLIAWHPDVTASHVAAIEYADFHYFNFGSSDKAGAVLAVKGVVSDIGNPRLRQREHYSGIEFGAQIQGQVVLERTHFDMFLLRGPTSGGHPAVVESNPTNVRDRDGTITIEYRPQFQPFEIFIQLSGDVRLDGQCIVLFGHIRILFSSNYPYKGVPVAELFHEPNRSKDIKILLTILAEKIVVDGKPCIYLGAGLNHFAHNFARDHIHSAMMMRLSGELREEAALAMVRALLRYVYMPGRPFTPRRLASEMKAGWVHHELFSRAHAWKMLKDQGVEPSFLGWEYLPSYGMLDTSPLLLLFADEVLCGDLSKLAEQEAACLKAVAEYVIESVAPLEQAEITPENLVQLSQFLPRFLNDYDGGLVGDWRDSHSGHCLVPEVASYNVVVLTRLALTRMARKDYFGWGQRADNLVLKLQRLEELFWTELEPAEANEQKDEATERLRLDPSHPWSHTLRFPCLSLGLDGSQVRVANSDVSFLLYYGEPTESELDAILDILIEPFPKGLLTPYGWAIATTAYGSKEHQAILTREKYHGDGVVWIWQFLMLLDGLRIQSRRDLGQALAIKLDLAKNYGITALKRLIAENLIAEELLNWKREDDGQVVAFPFAEPKDGAYFGTTSCPVQLWSLAGALLMSKNFPEAF